MSYIIVGINNNLIYNSMLQISTEKIEVYEIHAGCRVQSKTILLDYYYSRADLYTGRP
jgi:hypothetical protein